MLYAALSEHGANSEEQAQRRERRGSVPLTDGTNEGEADLNEVEATRYARQRTGRRLEHNLAPSYNCEPQKERVSLHERSEPIGRPLGRRLDGPGTGPAVGRNVSSRSVTSEKRGRGYAGMIEQVVVNLCVNTRDAMPNGGRLGAGSGPCLCLTRRPNKHRMLSLCFLSRRRTHRHQVAARASLDPYNRKQNGE